jgi:hypothetical protein
VDPYEAFCSCLLGCLPRTQRLCYSAGNQLGFVDINRSTLFGEVKGATVPPFAPPSLSCRPVFKDSRGLLACFQLMSLRLLV